jgi:hypothetical protein
MQLDPQAMNNLLQIMQNPAGQQLISVLRKKGGTQLETALKKAEAGNYMDVQNILRTLLSDPDAKKLLEELRK